MILNNAELKRNLWLDFSLQRVCLSILIITLLCYIIAVSISYQAGAYVAYALAYFFLFLWGNKNSSDCVIGEFNQNTWDFQRQSAQTPFEMSLGKLIGSTAFAWYCTFISIFIYCYLSIISSTATHSINNIFLKQGSHSLIYEVSILILCGLFTHSFALLLSLQVIAKSRYDKKIESFRYFIIAFIVGNIFYHSVSTLSNVGETVQWFQYHFNANYFSFTSLLLFLLWSLIGTYRSFSKELQYAQIPWVWSIFNVFFILYVSGAFSFSEIPYAKINTIRDLEIFFKSAPTYAALMSALILGYSAIAVDNLSYVKYKKFFYHIKNKQYLETLQNTPLWNISLLGVVVTSIIVLFNPFPTTEYTESFSSSVLVITIVCFFIRDILLIHYITFKQSKRIIATFVLYLFLLYILIPIVLRIVQLYDFLPLLIPSYGSNNFIAFIGISGQLILIGYLVWNKYQQYEAQAHNRFD